MPSPDESDRSAVVIEYLADIAAGRCTITDEQIDEVAETDPLLAEMLTGLLFLHEDLALRAEQRDRALAEAEAANQELQQLDELKSRFLAMASHELRTPLTAISGFSSTMLNTWQTLPEDEKHKFVGIIDGQSQRLTRLVDDLLTLSRIEGGALKTNARTVKVSLAIKQALRDLGAEHVEVACDDDVAVTSDADHFQQIIINYITNAIKYGGTPIKVEALSEDSFVRVSVVDHGAGVPVEFMPHLFEPFSQADAVPRGKEGKGTGLGLSIVYGLAKAQGGEAWYEPNTPTGSRFNVRLHRATAAA